MATKVGEFFISLAVDASEGTLSVNKLVASIGQLDVVSVAGVGILGKLAQVMTNLATSATQTAVELRFLQETTGAEPKIVQQWEKAAAAIGIHTGRIKAVIGQVNDMAGRISAREQGPSQELVSWLGIDPAKFLNRDGSTVKNAGVKLLEEIGRKDSRYWQYNPQLQQNLLGKVFPGGGQEIFQILNAMRAGKFHPETFSALSDKQIKGLSDADRAWTTTKQQLFDVFAHFITAGGQVADVLDLLNKKLEAVNRWLDSKDASKFVEGMGGSIREALNGVYNPLNGFGIPGQILAEEFGFKAAKAPPQSLSSTLAEWAGKLVIDINGPAHRQSREFFLGKGVKNADVQQVTVNAGNGGQIP